MALENIKSVVKRLVGCFGVNGVVNIVCSSVKCCYTLLIWLFNYIQPMKYLFKFEARKDYVVTLLNKPIYKSNNQNRMKKFFISVMLLGSSAVAFSQLLDVASVEKVALPTGVVVDKAIISPQGDYLLVSDNVQGGLQTYDLATSELRTVTKANGSSYDPRISADGKTIVYREAQVGNDRLRRISLKSVNMTTGETQTIVSPTRNLQGLAVDAAGVVAIDGGKMRRSSGASKATPVASIDKGQLMITVNGSTKMLSPNGTTGQSYLWPSVSPDGTRVLYYLATVGAYTCKIDGSDVKFVGKYRAARWYDNNTVVGMKDYYDETDCVKSSKIYAVSFDGSESQLLTADDVLAMYPSVNADGSKIAFSTPAGEAYIINVNVR